MPCHPSQGIPSHSISMEEGKYASHCRISEVVVVVVVIASRIRKGSNTSPDETPALGERIKHDRLHRPVAGVQTVPCKVVGEHDMSRFVVVLDTRFQGVWPVATDGVGQCGEEIAVPPAQRVAQDGEWTELDDGAMRHTRLHQCWAVDLGDLVVIVRGREDHPLDISVSASKHIRGHPPTGLPNHIPVVNKCT